MGMQATEVTPPGHRRVGAGGDGFFILEPRLAEVNVDVHQAGRHDLALGVDGQVRLDLEALADLLDLAVLDEDIGFAVQLVGWINNMAILD